MTSKRYYCDMLKRFFVKGLRLQRFPLRKAWFQQDGATAHTSKATIRLFKETFKGRVILKGAPTGCPPGSPDLTVPDFFLWGFVKSVVYATPVPSVRALKRRIRRCIRGIPAASLKVVYGVRCIPLPRVHYSSRGSLGQRCIQKLNFNGCKVCCLLCLGNLQLWNTRCVFGCCERFALLCPPDKFPMGSAQNHMKGWT